MIAGVTAQGARIKEASNMVDFVAASGPALLATSAASTALTLNAPSVVAGDLMIAAVMHRGLITPPAGWTLIGTATCTSGSLEQFTSLYKKVVVSGDSGASTSWARAGSWSCNVSISAYRGSVRTPNVLGYATTSRNSVTATASRAPMAEVTASANNQLGLCAASSVTSHVGGTYSVYTGTGFTMGPAAPPSEGRIAQAHKRLSEGGTLVGQFQNNTENSQQNGWACISALIG